MIAASTLKPYDPSRHGWTNRDAWHLLTRSGFGTTEAEIERATKDGLGKTVERILKSQPESDEFRETETLIRQTAFDTGNIVDLQAWWFYRMIHSANPLHEKMTLLWHNHFATSNRKIRSVDLMSDQNDKLRRHALGDFRKMLHQMAKDPAMLVWLDGNANKKRHPNENFARELMELFSLGVGNYTERDIQEAARAFSGWHTKDDEYWFNAIQHDAGTKSVFGKSGNFDGNDIVELCLQQKACPEFIAYKILREFVTQKPNRKTIETLGKCIRKRNFAMNSVMKELLLSELFYDSTNRNSIIKSPVQFLVGTVRTLRGAINLRELAALSARLGQDLFQPPTVKGWDGGRLWINAANMVMRFNFASDYCLGSKNGKISDEFLSKILSESSSQDEIVTRFWDMLFASPVERKTREKLIAIFREQKSNRSDSLRGLLRMMTSLPEYQLS